MLGLLTRMQMVIPRNHAFADRGFKGSFPSSVAVTILLLLAQDLPLLKRRRNNKNNKNINFRGRIQAGRPMANSPFPALHKSTLHPISTVERRESLR